MHFEETTFPVDFPSLLPSEKNQSTSLCSTVKSLLLVTRGIRVRYCHSNRNRFISIVSCVELVNYDIKGKCRLQNINSVKIDPKIN